MVAEKVRSYESTAEKALDERLTICMQTKAVNPKSEVSRTTTPIGSTPLLKLEFSEWLYPLGHYRGFRSDAFANAPTVDGSKQDLEVGGKNVREIFEDLDLFCSQIESKYEEQGKSID
jgi:hypothetical protein